MASRLPPTLLAVFVLACIGFSIMVVYGSYVVGILSTDKVTTVPGYRPNYSSIYSPIPDVSKTMELITQDAEHGHGEAQFMLGNAYYSGAVGQNYSKAFIWFSLAALNGYNKGYAFRYEVSANLSPAQVIEAKKEIATLQKKIKQ